VLSAVVMMMLDVDDPRLRWRRRVGMRLDVDDALRSGGAPAEREAREQQSQGLAQHG
jgi:hypothetical protein